MASRPYAVLNKSKALILQGRNKDGKTTLLRTSLPWWRRFGPWAYHGLYFNGEQGRGVSSFEGWQTTQLFGMTTRGGSELAMSLYQYRNRQWLRSFLQLLKLPVAPKPAIVIVDQFEELLKQYPQQALDWANVLTNQHVRFWLARVIFVVNSDKGTRTLLNLNQGDRFDVMIMNPAPAQQVRGFDEGLYEKCHHNIGLYKNVAEKLQAREVAPEDVDMYVREKLNDWEDDFHLPYPVKYDRSWKRLAEDSEDLMKERLGEALEQALLVQKDQHGQDKYTSEEVEELMKIVTRCWKPLDKMQVLDAMEAEWAVDLEAAGVGRFDAKSLAKHIRRLIGNPVPQNEGK